VNGLAKDIEAVGTVVKLASSQPAATPIRVGRQIINTSPSPEQMISSFLETSPRPATTIRVGRQIIQVSEAEAAVAMSETIEIPVEPINSLRVGRQILDVGTSQPSLAKLQASRESAISGEYAGGHFHMTSSMTG
jgi:hypothetical protein